MVDFGLARNVVSPHITDTDVTMGSPHYMSPEQARGLTREVDHRSDVFSLGSLLYFILTGHPPFSEPSLIKTLLAVIEREPVAPEAVAGTSPSVRLEQRRLLEGRSTAVGEPGRLVEQVGEGDVEGLLERIGIPPVPG